MRKFAVDMSSWTGVVTPDEARQIVAMGYSKVIVNLWCDGREYDSAGRKPGDRGYNPFEAKTTVGWQVDSFLEAGAEVDGYIYYYFAEDAAARTHRLLGNLQGRGINFLWLDWEDDETWLSPADTVAYIHRAQDSCIGIVYTGHYTRREWWIRRTEDSQDFAGQWLWDATNDETPDMSYNPYGGFKLYMEQFWFDVMILPDTPVDLNVYEDPDPAPAPEPEPPPPEPTPEPSPVEKAVAAVNKAIAFNESLRIALEEAKAAVEGIPRENLKSFISSIGPYRSTGRSTGPYRVDDSLWPPPPVLY